LQDLEYEHRFLKVYPAIRFVLILDVEGGFSSVNLAFCLAKNENGKFFRNADSIVKRFIETTYALTSSCCGTIGTPVAFKACSVGQDLKNPLKIHS